MLEWADDLKLCDLDLYLDSRRPRPVCFVSHAHSDHLPYDGPHGRAIATPATAALAEHRVGLRACPQGLTELPFGQDYALCPEATIRLLPAGHVLGSAMLHVTRSDGRSLLYTGDYKLRPGLTAERAETLPADVLVMESTYGQPFFRFPPRWKVIDELVNRVGDALKAGRQPLVLGYSLGKAQEATRILTDAGFPVTLHGAPHAVNTIHEKLGVKLGPFRRYAYADFHGPAALDLRERGVLVAPPSCARAGFCTRFKPAACRIVMTGWALQKNAIYRYGVEHALPLSDHADFDELMELIDRVRPRKIYSQHGFREFADILKAQGFDAELARPEEQLSLF